jgi:pyruvate ferredoxin oxidoreductase alpha subunit
MKIVALTGNIAIAEAIRQINPDVCAAYPITPSTEIMQEFSSMIANGKVNTELIRVESEHSAMSACIGASIASARVMTATSSQGLAYMWELLYIAASLRLPIVMACVNRALSGNINIHCDHSDSMGARDSGWIQIYSENTQEAYDNMILTTKIAENASLPAMVCLDGFITSHALERMELFSDEAVQEFLGTPKYLDSILDIAKPKTVGPLDLQDYYIEHKYQEFLALNDSKKIIKDAHKEFNEFFKKDYNIFETYKLDDAEMGVVALSSSVGILKVLIDEYRKKGYKIGLFKPRIFRPFYDEEFKDALKHLKTLLILDRADSFGAIGGPLHMEFKACLYPLDKKPQILGRIYGLGGRDFDFDQGREALDLLVDVNKTGNIDKISEYIGVRK